MNLCGDIMITAITSLQSTSHGQEYTDKTVYTRGGLIKTRGDMRVTLQPLEQNQKKYLKGRSAKFLELYRNRG